MTMARSLPCNMDCFNCIHPDCINNVALTKKQEEYFANKNCGVVTNTCEKKTKDMKEYQRRYYQQNREKLLRRSKEYNKRKKKGL